MVLLMAGPVFGKDLHQHAQDFERQLSERILPYWLETSVDPENGGYVMSDDAVRERGRPAEKQIVTQARMIWTFSHVHLKGFSRPGRDYLQAARQGYEFLKSHFYDREYGGYYWTTDLKGKPLNDNKILYGESFVVYALVEYYRASKDEAALRDAMDLYQVLQRHCHDRKNQGWFEHCRRDFTPLLEVSYNSPRYPVEVVGLKSANAHLHWMEALTELYEVTRDRDVRRSLREAVKINRDYFYPKDAGQSAFHRARDWGKITDPRSAGLSYGHNVEFAWLMIRAQQVLGEKPAWDHFRAHLDHALKYGYDHQRGGLYNRGVDDQPATERDKVWWVQAEMLAALSVGLKHQENATYAEALEKLLHFIIQYQADPKDGIWLDTVTEEGKPKSTGKAHNWKGAYHDVRAIVIFIEAFGKAR